MIIKLDLKVAREKNVHHHDSLTVDLAFTPGPPRPLPATTLNAHAMAAFIAPEPRPGPTPRATPMPPRFASRLQRGLFAPTLALAAGLFAALGFAPIGLFACTLFGLALLVVLAEAAPRRASVLGWAWGIGHFAFSVRWIAEAFTYQDKMPAWLGWVVVLGLAALLAALPALACWATWRFARRAPAAARLWAFPAAWTVCEWLRGHLFTGFPWNPLAAATLDVPGLAQPVAVVGQFGLSGFIALAAAALALWRFRPALIAWAALVVATVLLTATGSRGIDPFGAGGTDRPPTAQLLIVQPNIGQSEKWSPGGGAYALRTLMTLSHRPAPTAVPRYILWPEVALPENELEHEPRTRALLATLLRPGDLLLTGGLSVTRDAAGDAITAANSVFVIDAHGTIVGRYDKSHLVPGGEYVPLRPLADLLGLSRLAPGDLDFTPGGGPKTLRGGGLAPVGALVCYEIIFPAAIVNAADRPDWLFNPSNDAWFADTGPWQHLALARLQAIAEGLPIARSTPTGISALIGPRGELLASLPQRQAGVIEHVLPGRLPPTPYARLGDLIPLGLALTALALARRATRART